MLARGRLARWRRRRCAWAGVALGIAAVAASCGGPDPQRAAAEINGERVTFADLERYRASRFQGDPEAQGELDPEQRELERLSLLRDLIDQRLLLQVAAEQGVTASDPEVEAVIERHRLPYGTAEAFEAHLESAGIGLDDLQVEVRRRLTVEKLLNRLVSSKVEVSEAEMRDYYDRNLAVFTAPETQLHLAQIVVGESEVSPIPNLRNDDATDPDRARRKIRQILDELDEGADFEQLALHYSEDPIYASNGGDMGFVPLSALEKADVRLRRALVDLEPGDHSPIIETDGEFRILRLIAIEPAGQRSFDDAGVRESIRSVLANRKEQLLRAALYEVERNRAEIRNHLADAVVWEHGIAR